VEGRAAADRLFVRLSASDISDRYTRVVPIERANAAWDARDDVLDRWPQPLAAVEFALILHSQRWEEIEDGLAFLQSRLAGALGIVFFEDPELGGVEWPIREVLHHAITTDDGRTALSLTFGPIAEEGGCSSYSLTAWKNILDSPRRGRSDSRSS
jgi:hypothetical protein